MNGHPTPLITWKRNGILLDVIMRQSQLDKYYTYQSEVGSVFVLKVKTVEREEENDYYTCKVENDYGSLESKKAYLSMAGKFWYVCYDVHGVVCVVPWW